MSVVYRNRQIIAIAVLSIFFLFGGQMSIVEASQVKGAVSEGRGGQAQAQAYESIPPIRPAQRSFLHIEEQTEGQAPDKSRYLNDTDVPLFSFSLRPRDAENVKLSTLSLRLVVSGLALHEVGNIRLYRTTGVGDTLSEGDPVAVGVLSHSRGSRGTIIFTLTEALSLDDATSFLVVADLDGSGERAVMNIGLQSKDVVVEGSARTVGSVVVTHRLGRKPDDEDDDAGGGGGDDGSGGGDDGSGDVDTPDSSSGGGDRPGEQVPGAGDTTGGTSGGSTPSEDTETIGNEPGFYAPTVSGGIADSWENGKNALTSNDTYATSAVAGAQQTYSSFNILEIPSTNTITGITVKLEASATSEGGTISVAVSWDGGVTFSEPRTTDSLTTTDAVYTLGGPADIWGRTWASSDFSNDNLVVRITANPSGDNTLRLDAIQIAPHHQATGGDYTAPGRF